MSVAVAEPVKEPVQKQYSMPSCKKGRIVIFYADGDYRSRKGTIAVVTKVGYNAISVSAIVEDRATFIPQSGVRHCSDPELLSPEIARNGCWEDTDDTKMMLRLAELLETSDMVSEAASAGTFSNIG